MSPLARRLQGNRVQVSRQGRLLHRPGHPGRIAAAIEELNFQPNPIASGLASRQTQTIGVIVASVLNPVYPELITGIEEVLDRESYALIFGTTDDDAWVGRRHPEWCSTVEHLMVSHTERGPI